MDHSVETNEIRPEIPRRGFFKKLLAMAIGGIAVAIPGAAALMVFLDPLRKRGGGAAEFVPVTPLDALPADGSPRRFQIIADRTDAWTKHRNVPLGAVYVKREAAAAGAPKVVAFNALCPHAGCFVDVDADGQSFICPCHNSGFHPDGSLKPGCVSPRPLDTLEVDDAALQQGLVRVRFQNFAASMHDKKPV
jgi:menaquinol-cytochrome c reductase iron-sulfur subunit